ncbi:unnamed protein product [Mucor hiemalis]
MCLFLTFVTRVQKFQYVSVLPENTFLSFQTFQEMQLNFRIVGGKKKFSISIERNTTILEIKSYIEFTYNIPYERQTLIYESVMLKDKHTPGYYDMMDEDDVFGTFLVY